MRSPLQLGLGGSSLFKLNGLNLSKQLSEQIKIKGQIEQEAVHPDNQYIIPEGVDL